jgi:hypothetical protein
MKKQRTPKTLQKPNSNNKLKHFPLVYKNVQPGAFCNISSKFADYFKRNASPTFEP